MDTVVTVFPRKADGHSRYCVSTKDARVYVSDSADLREREANQ